MTLIMTAIATIPAAADYDDASPSAPTIDQDREVLFQVSTIDALLLAVYDGSSP